MRLQLALEDARYEIRLEAPVSLAIPLDFEGPQPSFFGAPRATATALEVANFIGDTRRGGSCNVAEIRLVPHCNGTHTETIGHIAHGGLSVHEGLRETLFLARLVTVTPCRADQTDESGWSPWEQDDRVITRRALAETFGSNGDGASQALLVRTLPNDAAKRHRDYGTMERPPFFTADALELITECGVQHLLVDIPSLDKMHDQGRLTNHRLFWQAAEAHAPGTGSHAQKTVTELMYVPNEVRDGLYLLDLQVPAFLSDAAPSRPIIYPLERIEIDPDDDSSTAQNAWGD